MKKWYVSLKLKKNNQAGYVSALALLIMSLFVAAGIAVLDNQQAIMKDASYIGGRAQAKFLAESAVQKGKYHVLYVNSNFTGTSPDPGFIAASPLG